MKTDPLETLVKTPDWLAGFKEGHLAGYDQAVTEMQGDWDEGEKYGFERGSKFLRNIVKISNQWNIREISANDAIAKIFKYLRLKVKL